VGKVKNVLYFLRKRVYVLPKQKYNTHLKNLPMNKQVFTLPNITDPISQDLHHLISEVMGEDVTQVSITPLSHDGVMKKIEEKTLLIDDMYTDMKISKSRFFQCRIEESGKIRDVYIQRFLDNKPEKSSESSQDPDPICKLAVYY
jgi:hypothetical protein